MPGLLAALAARRPVRRRVAIVVAHPDDETIAVGGSLHLLPDLLLVHVTDGAPRRTPDAEHAGFDTPAEYAAAREAELQAALAMAGASPRRATLGIPDQDAAWSIAPIADRLHALLAADAADLVLTHAYEGGHPDHDATACAVHKAARRLNLPVFEFAGYHAAPDGRTTPQRFLPGPPETRVALAPHEAALKQRMFDEFRTQAAVLALFDATVERFRPAPGYDFAAPPHQGMLNYESWGWEMTGTRWRTLAGTEECAA